MDDGFQLLVRLGGIGGFGGLDGFDGFYGFGGLGVTQCSSVKKVDTFKLRNLVIVLLLKARRRDVANRAVRSLPVVEELNVAV